MKTSFNIKPDVIVVWAKNNDYPLWRKFIKENRYRFNSVTVVVMEPNKGFDYSPFFREQLELMHVRVIDSPKLNPGEDWRSVAINSALPNLDDDGWIWFTEEDFYPTKVYKFFDHVNIRTMIADVISVYQGDRMHPCSIFIKKRTLSQLTRNFGIDPGVADHFCFIQRQVEEKGIKTARILKHYYHYNGFSHNWTLISEGQRAVYGEKEFIEHLVRCTRAQIPLHPEFVRVANQAIKEFYERQPSIN